MYKKPWVKPTIRRTSAKLEIIDRLSSIEDVLLCVLSNLVHIGQKGKGKRKWRRK